VKIEQTAPANLAAHAHAKGAAAIRLLVLGHPVTL
jgi:hypothetical protein